VFNVDKLVHASCRMRANSSRDHRVGNYVTPDSRQVGCSKRTRTFKFILISLMYGRQVCLMVLDIQHKPWTSLSTSVGTRECLLFFDIQH